MTVSLALFVVLHTAAEPARFWDPVIWGMVAHGVLTGFCWGLSVPLPPERRGVADEGDEEGRSS